MHARTVTLGSSRRWMVIGGLVALILVMAWWVMRPVSSDGKWSGQLGGPVLTPRSASATGGAPAIPVAPKAHAAGRAIAPAQPAALAQARMRFREAILEAVAVVTRPFRGPLMSGTSAMGTSSTMTGTLTINGGAPVTADATITLQSDVPSATEMRVGPPFKKIALGSYANLGLTEEGELWAWGYLVGNGTYNSYPRALQITATTDWADCTVGYSHAAALKTDGTLYMWGSNDGGQVGIGSTGTQTSPVRVGAVGEWKAVSLGYEYSIGLKKDGTLWGWGRNNNYQLGQGWNTGYYYTPTQIAAGSTFTTISAGTTTAYALKSNGALYSWGYNSSGESGIGNMSPVSTPQLIHSGPWEKVTGGGYAAGAIKTDGTLYVWGSNAQGQLGQGAAANILTATQCTEPGPWREFALPASGYNYSAAIKQDGSLWMSGYNVNGSLGTGDYTNRTAFTRVGAATGWSGPSIGGWSTGAFLDGSYYTWGGGNLGDGVTPNRNVPASVTTTWMPYSATSSLVLGSTQTTHTITMWYRDEARSTLGLTSSIYYDTTPPSGTMTVNGGVSVTDTTTVAVASNVTNVVDMRIGSGAWQPYASLATTQLASADGSQTITVTYRDEFARTMQLSSTIRLDTSAPEASIEVNGGRASTRFRTVSVVASATTETVLQRPGWYAPFTQIVTGGNGTIGLRSDGTVWSAGYNGYGQVGDGTTTQRYSFTQVVGGPSAFACVGVGNMSSYGIGTDGTLWAWGLNNRGQLADGTTTSRSLPSKVGTSTAWKYVAGGPYSAYALKNDGSLWAWGDNQYGQLGIGSTTPSMTTAPVRVGTASDYFKVVAPAQNSQFAFAVKTDGTLWAWGINGMNNLGDGTAMPSYAPIRIGTASNWVTAGANNYGGYAINTLGELYGWGYNAYGQIGDGTTVSKASPVRVGTDTDWKSIYGGMYAAAALKTDGTVWAWGANDYGQLGNGTKASTSVPVRWGTSSDVQQLSSGPYTVAAIDSGGSLWMSGSNGSLYGDGGTANAVRPIRSDWVPFAARSKYVLSAGDGVKNIGMAFRDLAGNVTSAAAAIELDSTIPTGTISINGGAQYATSASVTITNSVSWASSMSIGAPVTAATGGSQFGYALTSDGLLWGTGYSYYGAIGTPTYRTSFANFTGMRNWSAMAAGQLYGLLLNTSGVAYGVGENTYGVLGNGTTASASTPVPVLGGGTWQSISAGPNFAAGVKSDGTLMTWGFNGWGQLGDNSPGGTTRSTPATIGTNYKMVSAGSGTSSYSCLAIKNDGTMYGWGMNSSGQLGDGTTNTRYAPSLSGGTGWNYVDLGADHAVGLKADGSLYAWGSNTWGQIGDNTQTMRTGPVLIGTGWSRAAAGNKFSLGIKADGSLWTWGYNGYGTLADGGVAGYRLAPTRVGSDNDWAEVGTGYDNCYAVKTDGTLYSWGLNTSGELGQGTSTTVRSVTQAPLTTFGAYASSLAQTVYTPSGLVRIDMTFKDPADNAVTLSDDIIFDLNKPVTTLTGVAPSGWNNGPVSLGFSVVDTESGNDKTYYSINGADAQEFSGSLPITTEGTTTVGFRSVDKAGNSETSQTAYVRIDTVKPASQASIDATWRNSATVSIAATDSPSGISAVYYRIGAGAITTYTAPFAAPEGVSTIEYWAVDVAGNREDTRSVDAHIDLQAPVTTIPALPTDWVASDVTVSLDATDTGAGVSATRYRIDGGATQTYSDPFVIGDGIHTVEIWSEDVAGNVEGVQTRTLKVDTTYPATAASDDGAWRSTPVTVTLLPSDTRSGVAATAYRIDGGEVTPYAGPLGISVEGTTTLDYWSTDAMGNVEPTHTLPVRIDYTDPVTTISGVPSGVADAVVTVALDATDGGSGVSSIHYRLGSAQSRRYQPGQTGIVIAQEGTTTVEYWAQDGVGHEEAHQFAQVRIEYPNLISDTTRNSSCLACHSSSTGPQRVRLDFRVGAIDRTTTCPKCHTPGLAGTHPNHYQGGNCGACHPGWGSTLLTAVPTRLSAAGSFAYADSANLSSAQLHVIHSNPRWPATVVKRNTITKKNMVCGSCHAAVACTACHGDVVSPMHQTHSSLGSAAYVARTPDTTTVCNGIVGEDQSYNSVSTSTRQCSITECHNVGAMMGSAELWRENFTHAAYGTTPANTVVTSGKWITEVSAAFSSGQRSLSKVAGSTLSVPFYGTKVAVIQDLGPARGISEIWLDGVKVATVDCYAPTVTPRATVYTSANLSRGDHTIMVRGTGTKNAASTGVWVSLDTFVTWDTQPGPSAPICSDSCHPDRVAEHGYDKADHVADTGADIEPISGAKCSECHSMDLITEHERAGSASKGARCLTCHQNPRGSFVSWNQTCQQGGCHTPETTEERHSGFTAQHKVTTVSSCTNNCHEGAVWEEHAKTAAGRTAVGCVTCHNSTKYDANVRAVVWSKTCVTCHPDSHAPDIAGNQACYECHGSTDTAIDAIAGAGAWQRTGGDHEVGYAASAHGSRVTTGTNGAAASAVQCEACHNHNAIGVGVTTQLRAAGASKPGETLCFDCHSASGEETATPKPNTWNGRDVAAEFARTSVHPISLGAVSASSRIETVGAFFQNTAAEFAADQGFQTSVLSTSGVSLSWEDYLIDAQPRQLFMMIMGNYQYTTDNFQQYDPALDRWNRWSYDPTNPVAPVVAWYGSTAITVNNELIWNAGSGSAQRRRYTPINGSTPDTWTPLSDLPFTANYHVGATYDATAGIVYYNGDNTGNVIYRWRPADDTWLAPFTVTNDFGGDFSPVAADIAYSPQLDRLYITKKNSWSPGRIMWIDSPSTVSGSAVAHSVAVLWGDDGWSPSSTNQDLVRFTRNGVDYLAYACAALNGTSGNGNRVFLVGNLASDTPTVVPLPDTAWAGNSNGSTIRWDGGDYLYIVDENSTPTPGRLKIPANPMTDSWSAWQACLTPSRNWYDANGVAADFLNVTTPPESVTGYRQSGSISAEIDPPSGSIGWGALAVEAVKPYGTTMTIRVERFVGGGWEVVPGMEAVTASSVDLSGIDVTHRLRITAYLSTADFTVATPSLRSWGVTARMPLKTDGAESALVCTNCHNSHSVSTGGSEAWDLSRVSDPANTRNGATGFTEFCLTCHSSQTIERVASSTTWVPETIGFRGFGTDVFFPGWDKASGLAGFTNSGHYTTTGTKALCENCHDPHGSNNRSLTAWTRPAGFVTGVPGVRDNTSTAAFESNLCLQCHGNGTVGVGAPGAQDVASPMSGPYRHDVSVSGAHTDTETAASNGANRHAECVDCHDPHAARPGVDRAAGAEGAPPALLGATGLKPIYDGNAWTSPTGYAATRLLGTAGDSEVYVCLKCHSAASGKPNQVGSNGTTYTSSDIAQDFNPANPSYHNVYGLDTGMRGSWTMAGTTFSWGLPPTSLFLKDGWTYNSKVTCSDCHTSGSVGQAKGPHGGSIRYLIDPAYPDDWKYASLNSSNATHINGNIICLKCHVFPEVSGTPHWNRGVYGELGHMGDYCISCHISIPHGWKRPRLLAFATDPAPYRPVSWHGSGSALKTVRMRSHAYNGWVGTDCRTGCSGYTSGHYDAWPADAMP